MPGFWDYIQPPAPKPAPTQHRCDDYKCDECNPPRACASCGHEMHGSGLAHAECQDAFRDDLNARMDRYFPGMMRR